MVDWRSKANAPAPGTVLGSVAEVGRGGREYVFGRGLSAFRMFVVRHGDAVRGYVNMCPHYSLPLNHRADQFLSRDGSRIMCRQHLALFAIEDGRCLGGACEGEALQPVPLRLNGDQLVVE
ncbi:Rieske (2Fe-2S) protein [Sphingomonas fuzhouensis]|uniref:Rieske (2Fe-2S) protein n=1 Tax=Sphingomonas fuzhouensis TaxID=3106033 RepID=UPI002AFE5EF5|nr:Rieske 2Fe-2S domain-containing protein [Sphingomonas sp. SGZ-02]